MSKKDLVLLGYLGYKAVKEEPDRVGVELGNCLLGWFVAMGLALVLYVLMTLFFEGLSLIMNNLEGIVILIAVIIFVGIVIIVGYMVYEPSESKIDKSKFSKVDKTQMKKELELAREEKRKKEQIHKKEVNDLISVLDEDSFDILYKFEFIEESWSKEQVINHFLLSMPAKNVLRLIEIVKSEPYEEEDNVLHDILDRVDNLNNNSDVANNNLDRNNKGFGAWNNMPHEKLLDVFLDETKIWNDEYKVDVYNKQDLIDYFQQNYTGNDIYQLFK